MKKVLWLALVLVLALTLVAGCGSQKATEEEPGGEVIEEETPENGDVESGSARLGLGIVPSIASSRDAEGDITAQAQTDVVMAAVLFDGEGRVEAVSIDTAQTMVAFDEALQVTSDLAAAGKTKKELGDDYGMKKASAIDKEWFEQIAEFEEWMIGQTVEEIASLKVKAVDENHQHVPDVPELTSVVTMDVGGYIAAVVSAYDYSVEVENAVSAGVGASISIGASKSLDAASDVLPAGQVDNAIAAVAFDADGVIVGALIDNAQIKVEFDEEGQVTSDRSVAPKTKIELGDDYGMKKASAIDKEWYEQIASFIEWMIGKTTEEVLGLPVKVVNDDHQHVPDVPELTSSVTVTVEDYQAAVANAFADAKVAVAVP